MSKKEKSKNPNRFPVGKFFAWKSRNISLAGSFLVVGYLSIYATDALHMPPALVGTLLLASKIFDGFTDIFAGFLIDNTRTRFGKGRPYELCIIGVWLCTILMYSVPGEASMVIKSIWILLTYAFVNSIFATLLNGAETPYMIRAFGSKQTIVKIASFGGIVSTVGSVIISISFPILMRTMATSPEGWRSLVLIYAIPLALIGILRFIFVKEEYNVDNVSSKERVKLKEVIQVFKINPYVWLMAGIYMMFNIVTGMNAASYYFTYIVGDIGKFGALQAITIVMLLFMFGFPKIMKKHSVSVLIMAGALLGVIGSVINFFAGSNMGILIVGFMCTGLAALPTSYLTSILIMDCSSYNEWKGHARLEGTSSTLSGLAQKLGSGIGAGVLGILLGVTGYNGEVAVQTASANMMIRLSYSIIPAIAYVFLFIFAYFYGHLDKMMPQIEKENQERRAKATVIIQGNLGEIDL